MSAKSASLVLHPGDGDGVHDVAQVLLLVAVVILQLLGIMNQLLDDLRRSALVTDVAEKSDSPATFYELALKLCFCVPFTVLLSLLTPHTKEAVVGPERTVLTHRLRGSTHNNSTVLTPAVLR